MTTINMSTLEPTVPEMMRSLLFAVAQHLHQRRMPARTWACGSPMSPYRRVVTVAAWHIIDFDDTNEGFYLSTSGGLLVGKYDRRSGTRTPLNLRVDRTDLWQHPRMHEILAGLELLDQRSRHWI